MPLPAKVTWVTFDVYGTLIDWEAGILDAFQRRGRARGLHDRGPGRDLPALPRAPARDRGRLVRALRRGPAPLRGDDRQGDRLAAGALAQRASCPTRSRAGARSRRRTRSWTRFGKKFQTGLISNIDDKLLGETRRHIPHDFDLVVTAQQVRSYKPDAAHFTEFARRVGGKKNWVHICLRTSRRRRARAQGEGPGHLGQPPQGAARPAGAKKPTAEVKTLLEAAKLLGAV